MKLTEHEMLVTLATMAIKMDDLTGHDVVEALRAHGYDAVVAEARSPVPITQQVSAILGWEGSDGYVSLLCSCGKVTGLAMCSTDSPVRCDSCCRRWKFSLKVACEPVEEKEGSNGN